VKKIERVLLIDDDPIVNTRNKALLEYHGFSDTIIIKNNSQDALNYLEKECDKEKGFPNLIILDLKMPGMDGFEFLVEFEKICAKLRFDTVVVILTVSRDPDDFIKLRQLGNYYIFHKPLKLENLDDIYSRYFRHLDVV
jgi:DNA-binding response OmpR family regulator